MVYFTEKLIHEIQRRSCIWDTADVNHLNKEVLTNMWMEIGENLYSDWHSLSAFDQRDRVADVKKKWTNIKDSFVKDVKGKKPRKSRGPPEHRKKYYLFDHLQFLIPFIQDSKPSNNNRSLGRDGHKRLRKTLGEGSSRGQHSASVAMATAVAAAAAAAGRSEISADVQQNADLLNNYAGKPAADALCHLDGDLSFMVSLLPTVKSMNEKQKINFKIGVLQLLARIKFNEVLQNPGGDAMTAAAAAAACQPFVAPDLRCFPVPYQPKGMPFPFINHHHQAAVSSTQQHRRVASTSNTTPPMKRETVADSSSPTSTFCDTDLDDDDDDDDDDNDDDDDDNDGGGGGGGPRDESDNNNNNNNNNN